MADSRPVVAHCVTPYLFLTGSWIHSQLAHARQFRPIVLTDFVRNRDLFPAPDIYSLADLGGLERWLNRVQRKLTGEALPFWQRASHQERARLVHSHFGQMGYCNRNWVRRLGVPHLVTFYGNDVSMLPQQDPAWRERYQRMFAGVRFVLAEGSHMRERIIELGCAPDKVRIQRLGVDLSAIPFVPRTLPRSGPIRVLMAGTFREKKGLAEGAEAIGRLVKRNPDLELELIIIGDSTGHPVEELQKRRIIDAIARNRLEPRTHLKGFIPLQQLHEIAQTCHIFLSPSVHASDGDTEGGAPVTIIEMAASGMPIVSTTHCDIPEVVREGGNALLAPERDVEALVEHLETLLSQGDRWAAMGQAGREHVERFYDARQQAQQLEAVYMEALG